jgi:2-polyprenyl-3-methyl-5-hydroxy-6-metoxy-1,4-benzoquinol methylase
LDRFAEECAQMEPLPLYRSCPSCDQTKTTPLFTKGTLRIVQCNLCSMLFANPISAELASGTFYDRLGTSFYLSQDKLESDYAPIRFERELRCFRQYCRRGTVLDVGCSSGAFLFNLKTRFPGDYSVTGTDVTGAALDYAESRGIQVIRTPFLDLDLGEPCFDAITFWAVIEHLAYPKDFLAKSFAILKPGGFCFILVPNMKSLAVRLLGSRYRYIMPDHVNYFTPATLQAFALTQPGFEVLTVTSTHFNPVVILKDFRAEADRVSDATRAQLLKRTTAWKQNPLLRPLKLVYDGLERALASCFLADNLVIVLRKKSG